jgi:hypothetical protein
MALPKEYSVMGGVATAALVYGVYSASMPSAADARSMKPNDDLQKSERTASWIAAGTVAGVSLLAKDPTIFIIGGAMVVAMAWMHRHANAVIPNVGKATLQAVPRVSQETAPTEYATPKTAGYGAAI